MARQASSDVCSCWLLVFLFVNELMGMQAALVDSLMLALMSNATGYSEPAAQVLGPGVEGQPGDPIVDSTCSMPCSGDATQVCGGPNANSLYRLTIGTPKIPVSYDYVGCYADTNSSDRRMWRRLGTGPGGGNLDIPMGPTECAQRANITGYPYFAISTPIAGLGETFGYTCWGGEYERDFGVEVT